MIGSYLIENQYKLIKVIRNQKIVVPAYEAIDNRYILKSDISIGANGRHELKNIHRVRPYYSRPYKHMFCDLAPNCDLECQKCYDLLLAAEDAKYWDGYDIGFPGGTINNILIFDIDPRNIPNFKDLKTSLSKIEKSYGPLPKTWTSSTPSGGLHLYFQCDVEFNKNTSIEGVDIIGTGFWVKLPPYTNGKGIPYTWKFAPGVVPLAKAPPWLYNKVSLNKQSVAKRKDFVSEKKDYPPNDTRDRVKQYLDRLPIENFRGSEDAHTNWLAIGRYLCSSENNHLGTKQLFLDWCSTDSKGTLSPSQLTHFENRTDCHIGKFFVLVKDLLGEK